MKRLKPPISTFIERRLILNLSATLEKKKSTSTSNFKLRKFLHHNFQEWSTCQLVS